MRKRSSPIHRSRPATDGVPYGRPVIVFDAECVVCSANAQFVLKHDRAGHFYLASMQGAAGSALYRKFGIDPHDPDTMIVVVGDRALRNSDAVLAIYGRLGWPWRAAVAFKIVPRPVRDAVYLFLARNRYRLFGRRDRCWVPDAAQAERVL